MHIVGGPRIARVYRQGTTPTGAQDGDTWQDTSTGIQYERVAGAWQAVVGAGSVGTGQLVDNAATEVQESFSAGPIAMPGPGNIKTLSVTNPNSVPRQVIVHCTLSLQGTAAGGSDVQSALLVVENGTTPVYAATMRAAAGTTINESRAFSITFLMAAGATNLYHIAHQAPSLGSWSALAFSGVTQRTELIKK